MKRFILSVLAFIATASIVVAQEQEVAIECDWGLLSGGIVVPEGGKNLVALDMIMGRIARHLEETEKE